MKKSIVYYHPRRIKENPDRGSDLRVARMLEAFQQLDYEVIVIAGRARNRHRKIRQLKRDIASGLKIEFVYGESTNAPILFADKRLLPSNFLLDYGFFSWLKHMGIPLGVYYRDVYWRFELFKQQLAWPFNIILKPLYYLDWRSYDKYCSVLFLPSTSMNQHLPRQREAGSFLALPPGFGPNITPRPPYTENSRRPLELLYVGGIEPTVYDIENFLGIVSRRNDLRLTICCRQPEWEKYCHRYVKYMADNIKLVHVTSDQLADYYHAADLSLMLMDNSEYMDFAVPVKLFETVGYCVPIVSLNHREVANYVRSTDIGWILNDLAGLDDLMTELSADRGLIAEKYLNLLAYRPTCTWAARAESASAFLADQHRKRTETS